MSRYDTITDIKHALAVRGSYWFSKDTVAYFKSRVETRVRATGLGNRAWIESTTNYDDSAREYKVVRFIPGEPCEVGYVMPEDADYTFPTLKLARAYLDSVLADI
jgi:hypothetical protein